MNFTNIIYGRHCVKGWRWSVEENTHPAHTLWCICGGKGTLKVGDKSFMLCRGDIFYLNYNKPLVGIQDDENPLHVQYVDFIPDKSEDTSQFVLHKKVVHMNFILSLLERIRVALQKSKDEASLWLNALLQEYQSLDNGNIYSPYSEKIGLLCERIRQTPGGDYCISEFAEEFGLSIDHFIRIFKKETGQSPYAFIQQARLDLAQICLRYSNMSITQIAINCGFSDLYSFSKFFKSRIGMSPRAFRNR